MRWWRSVEVEAFLHGGSQQTLPHDVLRGIFRKLQVVNTCVDRRVAGVCGVHLGGGGQQSDSRSHQKHICQKILNAEPIRELVYLPNNGEAGVQVGKATGGQRGAAGGELQERLPLVR